MVLPPIEDINSALLLTKFLQENCKLLSPLALKLCISAVSELNQLDALADALKSHDKGD